VPDNRLSIPRLTRRAAFPLLIALVLVADVLLFDREAGINRFLFCLLVAGSIFAVTASRNRGALSRAAAFTILSILPMAEAPTFLSRVFASLGLVVLALAAAGLLPKDPAAIPAVVARFLLKIPSRSIRGVGRAMQVRTLPATTHGIARELRFWIMPLVVSTAFIALFAGANPLIERALEAIDLAAILKLLDLQRMIFWALTAGCVWVLMRPKLSRRCRRPLGTGLADGPSAVVSEPVLLRALLLFNLLFGIQTGLDMAYLWGGLALPEGMSYAEYAHRGAYPLVVTALLAALFVLLTVRRDDSGRHARLIRALVYLWIGQNIMLCLSAILRLDLYVAAYSLTGMRVAAGLWMLLVALGLMLIMLRILLDRSNAWLFAWNMAGLLVVLYGVAVTDVDGIVARYNIEHSRDLGGSGQWLDITYLASLGPAAVPAIDSYLARASFRHLPDFRLARIRTIRADLAFEHTNRPQDWREWTWRGQRLDKYLAGPVRLD
jgi:hypothetical protein